ncbi:ParA family protein [Candidatus Woesearchaeota archaeon]|nr:ParA family protein [Candidatus Woesearchaeota archaeon]
MRKICIINQKGGVGKTTTTINLGAGLSRMERKVLIMDLDPQGNVGVSLNQFSEKDMYALLVESADPGECIRNMGKNLDMISSKENLTKIETAMTQEQQKTTLLKRKMEKLTGYDYVLLDCPPSMGTLATNCMLYAEEAFIPVSTDFLGFKALKSIMKTIETVNEQYGHHLKVTKIIPTMYDQRSKLCKQILNEMKNEFYELVAEPIRVNSKLKEAPSAGKSIFSYDKESTGAKDYFSLVKAALQDEELFLKSKASMVSKVKMAMAKKQQAVAN